MRDVFFREIRANLKGLLFWCVGLCALAAVGFVEFGMIKDADMNSLVDIMPRVVRVMMGFDRLPISSAQGYFACMAVWLAVIAFLHAALLGANIVAKEERDRTSDFIFTKPILRSRVLSAKILAAVVNVALVFLVMMLTTLAAFIPQIDQDIIGEVLLCFLGMFIIQLVFLSVGFLSAALVRNPQRAGAVAASAVLVTYFLSILLQLIDRKYLYFLSPFLYFDAATIILDGFSWVYSVLAVAIVGFAVYFGYRLYLRRNLHS